MALRMERVAAGAAVDAAWIDPRTGRCTPLGRRDGSEIGSFTTPAGWPDALLLLEVQA